SGLGDQPDRTGPAVERPAFETIAEDRGGRRPRVQGEVHRGGAPCSYRGRLALAHIAGWAGGDGVGAGGDVGQRELTGSVRRRASATVRNDSPSEVPGDGGVGDGPPDASPSQRAEEAQRRGRSAGHGHVLVLTDIARWARGDRVDPGCCPREGERA